MKVAHLAALLLASFTGAVMAQTTQDIRVSAGDVKDSRTTEKFFAGLDVQLKLIGEALENAKSLRCKVSRAIDDTGRDLLKEEEEQSDFSDLDSNTPGQAEVTVKLKNPSRRAMVVKELSGSIELFRPKLDPNSVVTIKKFTAESGKAIEHASLKAANVGLSILTKKQYESLSKKSIPDDDTSAVMNQMIKALAGLFGGMMEVGENSVIIQLVDPELKVMKVEFLDGSGKQIDPQSSMRMEDVRVYDFDRQMPATAQLRLYIATPASLLSIPFAVSDISLP